MPELEDSDLAGGEVEIARLYRASGAGNTISLRATQAGVTIHLRAVHEYEGVLSIKPNRLKKPFTNEEVLSAVKTLRWNGPLGEGLVWTTREYEAETSGEEAGEFITGDSAIYPAFESYVERDNRDWVAGWWSCNPVGAESANEAGRKAIRTLQRTNGERYRRRHRPQCARGRAGEAVRTRLSTRARGPWGWVSWLAAGTVEPRPAYVQPVPRRRRYVWCQAAPTSTSSGASIRPGRRRVSLAPFLGTLLDKPGRGGTVAIRRG